MHFPEGKLFPSAGIGEIRQASGVTVEKSPLHQLTPDFGRTKGAHW
jgi:hypothetical protein